MPSLPAPGESRALIEQEISFANWETLCAGELAFHQKFGIYPHPKFPPCHSHLHLVVGAQREEWGLSPREARLGRQRAAPGEVTKLRGDRLPGVLAPWGLDTVPSEQGAVCCAAVSMEPGFTSGSMPQRGLERDGHTPLNFY